MRISCKKKLASAVCSFLTFLATAVGAQAADWQGVFEGTLGSKPILVQLTVVDPASTEAFSRYSYIPNPGDLYLVPDDKKDGHSFVEATSYKWASDLSMKAQGVTGHWLLDVKGDVATGTWRGTDASKPELPITLKRVVPLKVDVSEGVNPFWGQYENQAVAHDGFGLPQKPVSFGAVSIAMVYDKVLGLGYPRLVKHPDKAVMEKANVALEEWHRQELVNYRSCADDEYDQKPRGTDAQAEYSFAVEYASPSLLSISQTGSNHCSGAHNRQVFLATTYDLNTMEIITDEEDKDVSPEGFGRIFKMDTKAQRIAFENLWWKAWLKMAKATGDNMAECAPEIKPGTVEGNFYFTRKGLAVLENDHGDYGYPRNCMTSGSTPTIIPWKRLKPFLKQGQTLLRSEVK